MSDMFSALEERIECLQKKDHEYTIKYQEFDEEVDQRFALAIMTPLTKRVHKLVRTHNNHDNCNLASLSKRLVKGRMIVRGLNFPLNYLLFILLKKDIYPIKISFTPLFWHPIWQISTFCFEELQKILGEYWIIFGLCISVCTKEKLPI